ncbi:MAG: hypothetical protein GY851_13470, partial [bacterium]|nr:hypothetical protein [bacterium]
MTAIKLSDLAAGAPVHHWLVLGPFIVETPGHFEREYLYERERILDIDYLAQDVGEASVVPEAGKVHANVGLGAKQLAWFEYPHSELHGMHIAGDLIYETVQRNCVIYAAATIRSEHEGPALLDAYHSGMKVWVNGELACNEPYGLPKGVRLTMPSKLIHLRQGDNLLLVKFRPGYIADGVDFRVRDVRISPMVAERGIPIALGRVRALPLFTGTIAKPRQVIEAALVNTSHTTQRVDVTVDSKTLGDESHQHVDCDPGAVVPVRLSLLSQPESAGDRVKAVVTARVYGRDVAVPVEYEAAMPPKYDGTSFVLTSFHFDTTYHEEQRVYAMGAFDIVRQYCELHRADPHFRSIISEVDYLKPYFDVFPEDRATLMKAFREKRSEPDATSPPCFPMQTDRTPPV